MKIKIAVIGAGLSGLNSARILSERAKVVVFEAQRVGGMLSSYCRDNYCIETFYHHFFENDTYLINTLKELNLSGKIKWKYVKVGQEYGEKIYSLTTPLEILKYPGMNFLEKLKLIKLVLSAKRREFNEYDEIGVIDGILNEAGKELFEKFFLPLLRSKFGENYREVSYAWLLARMKLRSNRNFKGEKLGYLRHGFWQMIERLAENVEIRNERAKISKFGKWKVNGESFDVIIFTAPIPELDLNIRNSLGLPKIRYQSSICMLIGMKDSFSDIYWINYSSTSFGATIEHTNFMPIEDYGEHIMYVASYTTPEKIESIRDEMLIDLKRVYLKELERFGLDTRNVKWSEIFKAKYSGPIYERGYMKNIPDYRIHDGFYIAGMNTLDNYPERSMNGSLLSGKKVADLIIKDFSL